MTTMTEIQATQVYQVFILATPEQIWEAITKPEFTSKYFHGVTIDTTPEERRSFQGGELKNVADVLEFDPPRRLVHSWISYYDPEMAAEEPSRVSWEIEPQEDGTSLLTVVHDQLEGAPKTAAGVAGPGWTWVLSGLKTLLETGSPLGA
jgi:uncharacterized protein YndB with AHSA1/START domain